MSRRIIILSDLHLGGPKPSMMSSPEQLARLIRELPQRRSPGESLELVIAGDFVDFLAIEPFAAWTPDPDVAVSKLRHVMDEPPFAQVFDELAEYVRRDHTLAVLVGNHDVELGLPPVQWELLRRLGASAFADPRIVFYDDNRPYRAGGLLVEHGNRYDGANENDWSGLRAIASAVSRFEVPRDTLEVSAGSVLVEKLVSPFKQGGYSFVDLVQPQGELLALLLLAFEPSLVLDMHKIVRVLRANRLQHKNPSGTQPGETRHVSFRPEAAPDPELLDAFGDFYLSLRQLGENVSIGDLALTAWAARSDSLKTILDRGDPVPPKRLQQIRAALRKLVLQSGIQLEAPAENDGLEQYGLAAERIRLDSNGAIQSVAMGHTHLPKHVGPADRATYVNTGTWADIIRVPPSAVHGSLADLEAFLRQLDSGVLRTCPGTYAEVVLGLDGNVQQCRLARAPREWWTGALPVAPVEQPLRP